MTDDVLQLCVVLLSEINHMNSGLHVLYVANFDAHASGSLHPFPA